MSQRFTAEESAGSQRRYSYLLDPDEVLPLGSFPGSEELPDAIGAELEALAQSGSAPPFLWEPEGGLLFSVESVEEEINRGR